MFSFLVFNLKKLLGNSPLLSFQGGDMARSDFMVQLGGQPSGPLGEQHKALVLNQGIGGGKTTRFLTEE